MTSLEQRFRAKFTAGEPADCWLWQGARIPAGYGHLRRGGRREGTVYAHRLAYELTHGLIPDDRQVHHRCEQPLCVNPAHLELLDLADHARHHNPRADRCSRGHDLADAQRKADGRVAYCRECRRLRRRARGA